MTDLEADGLAKCQQIRSPESAASLGPSQGTNRAASPQGPQAPGAVSPSTLATSTEASRGEGTLGWAQLRSRGRAPCRPSGTQRRWDEGWSQNQPREIAWCFQPRGTKFPALETRDLTALCSQASSPSSVIRPRRAWGLVEREADHLEFIVYRHRVSTGS